MTKESECSAAALPGAFALVTGASSGIGRALAEEFAQRGYGLVLVALPGTGLEEVSSELSTRYRVEALAVGIDLCNPDAPEQVFAYCVQRNIRINVLVNCAGIGNLDLFDRSDWAVLQRIMVLNNVALVGLTHKFLPSMSDGRGGHILNVGSLASFLSIPGKAVYSASKSFVYSFSRALRTELKQAHVKVCCLCPGGTLATNLKRPGTMTRTSYRGTSFIQTPQTVARVGVKAMLAGHFRVFPGLSNQLIYFIYRVLPAGLSEWIMRRIFLDRLLARYTPNRSPYSVAHTIAYANR